MIDPAVLNYLVCAAVWLALLAWAAEPLVDALHRFHTHLRATFAWLGALPARARSAAYQRRRRRYLATDPWHRYAEENPS